jgi:hypothetical protein
MTQIDMTAQLYGTGMQVFRRTVNTMPTLPFE